MYHLPFPFKCCLQFFLQNKGTRGSANGFYAITDRNLEWFNTCDINDVEDNTLAEQNKKYKIALKQLGKPVTHEQYQFPNLAHEEYKPKIRLEAVSGHQDRLVQCKTDIAGISIKCIDNTTSPDYPKAKYIRFSHHTISERVENRSDHLPLPPVKYYLSVVAMFKNEAVVIKEWLDHHIGHGIDHFYLVNDNSDDKVEQILQPYVDKGVVTMYPPPPVMKHFRVLNEYNRILQAIMSKNESFWVVFLDLDEFLWAPKSIDVRKVLKKHERLSVIGLNWAWFGSNGHIQQPKYVIEALTKRAGYDLTKYQTFLAHHKWLKYESQKNIINVALNRVHSFLYCLLSLIIKIKLFFSMK